jgi:hypothetical protein
MFTWAIVAVISVALLGGAFVVIARRARARSSQVWSETEAEYQARHERAPKLEETLKGYAFRPPQARRAAPARVARHPHQQS